MLIRISNSLQSLTVKHYAPEYRCPGELDIRTKSYSQCEDKRVLS